MISLEKHAPVFRNEVQLVGTILEVGRVSKNSILFILNLGGPRVAVKAGGVPARTVQQVGVGATVAVRGEIECGAYVNGAGVTKWHTDVRALEVGGVSS